LTVKKTKAFDKLLDKLVSKGNINREEVDDTVDLFLANPKDKDLRPHWIDCGKNHKLLSLSIPNSQYRILATVGCTPKIAIFHFIGKHKEYEIIIKNFKNCKHIKHTCEELKEMPCYEKMAKDEEVTGEKRGQSPPLNPLNSLIILCIIYLILNIKPP
jgi:hypothetical protein